MSYTLTVPIKQSSFLKIKYYLTLDIETNFDIHQLQKFIFSVRTELFGKITNEILYLTRSR